jgi:diacylglycerol O-acyltransferase
MSDSADVVDMPDELGAVDTLLHRGEANPRTRSGIMSVEILDCTPDWNRFRSGLENASRRVLRMRQKVVMPTLPTAAPHWVVDPDFNLDFHVRRVRVPEPGTLREVLDMAEVIIQSPFDISRPLWSITLVEGLPDGQAAVMFHMSHVISDGMGGVELFVHVFDFESDPPPRPTPPLPVPHDLSPNDLMRRGINNLPGSVVGGVRGALWRQAHVLGRVVRNPKTAVEDVIDYVRSTARMMSPAAEPSPLLRGRSRASRSEALDMKLSDLRKAAKAADGSINDAYLAGLCGALRRYHEALGVPISTLPMAVPVSLRSEGDPAGGNRFTGVYLAAPVGEADAAARIRQIRAQMTQRREERAIDIISGIAPALSVLPDSLLELMVGSLTPADVQASNVPFYPEDIYIAGAKVLRQYVLGPLPGIAMMVVLVSLSGICTVTARYDRSSVTDEGLFARCLQEGFNEVLALAGDPAARSAPASCEAGS